MWVAPILNQKKNGREAFAQLWSADIDPKRPGRIGGPFKLSRFVPSQRVELHANKNYFAVNKEGKRLPYLDKLTYLVVPDARTNLLKFHNREIDLTPISPRDVAELLPAQKSENFKLYNLGVSIGSNFFMVNMNRRADPKTKKPYVNPTKSIWFNDTNFRQAINHTINRDQLVANYFKGIAAPSFTAEPQTSPWCNTNLKPFKADVDYAMSLLTKSGFKKN